MDRRYKIIIETTLVIDAPDREQALRAAKSWEGAIESHCVGELNYSLRWNGKARVKSAKWINKRKDD